jgi:hypothetical protein
MVVLALLLVALPCLGAVGSWAKISNFTYGNPGHMLLLPDGTVMVQSYGAVRWYRLTPDNNGHYLNGNWTTNEPMHDSREYYSSDVLQDGRVFVAGGEAGSGFGTAEIFNPQDNGGSGSWTYINPPISLFNTNPPVNSAFLDSDSILLSDGTLLITPVISNPNDGSLIYNPSANSWSATTVEPLVWQDEATWIKLPDDSILTIDPAKSGLNTAERYFPSLKAWVAERTTPVVIFSYEWETGGGFMMSDGRAFFLGGTGHTVFYNPTGNTNEGSWTPGPDMPYYNGAITYWNSSSKTYEPTNYNGLMVTQDTPAAMMNNGKILCQLSFDAFFAENIFYEFDPSMTNFVAAPSPTDPTPGAPFFPLSTKPSATAMLDLPDGTVLYNDSGALYIYTPDSSSSPLSSGKPAIRSVSWNADGSLHLTGTLFNGISQGVSYGDDAQMDSNYPLVRFTDASGNVTYGRTYNWSSTSVQTGNKVMTTECKLPANAYANGSAVYSIQVVANGNASDAVGIYGPVWVDFNYSQASPQLGTYANPYSTLGEGVTNLVTGSTISIKPGASTETLSIAKAMTINAVGGTATVGQ